MPADAAFRQLRAAVAAEPLVPPVPKPVQRQMPLWSLLRQLRVNALPTWAEEAYDAPIVARPFLGRTSFLLNDPAAIRRVLVENPDGYSRTPAARRILHPMIGDGLFLAEGADWRRQRRLTAPAMAPRALDLVAAIAGEQTGQALAALRPRPRNAVDLLAFIQRLTLEIAGRALFSQAMTAHGTAVRDAINGYGRFWARPMALDFFLPPAWPAPQDWFRDRFARRWRRLLDRIIAERAAVPPTDPPADLFDVLRTAGGDGDAPFTTTQLRDQVATLLIAGHETTALALFWSCHLLAQAPAVQELVAAEARTLDGQRPSAAAVLADRPLALAVVKEALRLYPPAFTVVRLAVREDEILGRKVPEGSLCVMAPWVLHRHRRLWTEPARFDPGRFLPDAPPPDRYAWLPFGIGPRVCVGAQFALVEACLVLSRLVGAYRLEPVDRRPLLPVGVVTVVPERSPPFRLVERAGAAR
ncbi:MAG: cytochrome P450 [Geminicoccaceae bacterium]